MIDLITVLWNICSCCSACDTNLHTVRHIICTIKNLLFNREKSFYYLILDVNVIVCYSSLNLIKQFFLCKIYVRQFSIASVDGKNLKKEYKYNNWGPNQRSFIDIHSL